MEGFLRKRARGEKSLWHRSEWAKRWFVLEGNVLEYFETYDLQQDAPVHSKGIISMRDTTVVRLDLEKHKFCFSIRHPQRQDLMLQAESQALQEAWVEALVQASKEEDSSTSGIGKQRSHSNGVRDDLPKLLELLGLPNHVEPTAKDVYKAYKEKARKLHPDKGGDPKLVNEAYQAITDMLKEMEDDAKHQWVEFSVSIIKGPPGEGLGVVVVENKAQKCLEVREVLPCMVIHHIDGVAGGSISKGDVLIRVGKEDISAWPLRRVLQRVGEFRAPTGRPIKLGFRRRVLRPGYIEEQPVQELHHQEQQHDDAISSQSVSHHKSVQLPTDTPRTEETAVACADAFVAGDLLAADNDDNDTVADGPGDSPALSSRSGGPQLSPVQPATDSTQLELLKPEQAASSSSASAAALLHHQPEEVATASEGLCQETNHSRLQQEKEALARENANLKHDLREYSIALRLLRKELAVVSELHQKSSLRNNRSLMEEKKLLHQELEQARDKQQALRTVAQELLLINHHHETTVQEPKHRAPTSASPSLHPSETVLGHWTTSTTAEKGNAHRLRRFEQQLRSRGVITA